MPNWDTSSQKPIIDIEVISDQITDFRHLKDLNFDSFKIAVSKIWEKLVLIKNDALCTSWSTGYIFLYLSKMATFVSKLVSIIDK